MTRLALVGATASGKSALALAYAERTGDVELVSADSMQVYRRMDIGTAKPSPGERAAVGHHLIDLVDVDCDFAVGQYQRLAVAAIDDIERRGAAPLLVGGTGLYVRAVVDELRIPGRYPEVRARLEATPATVELYEELVELDPAAAARILATNRRRIVRALEVCLGSGEPFSSFGPGLGNYPPTDWRMIGLDVAREELDRRVEQRLLAMLDAGLLDEVERLVAGDPPMGRNARQALGYKELIGHLDGRVSLEEAVSLAVARTRRFARRQLRWFRRDPRIVWIPAENSMEALGRLGREWVPG